MNIQFDGAGTKHFFEWIATKLVEITLPKFEEILKNAGSDEELLTRKEVADRILKCDVKTFDKCYRYAPGFPKIEREGSEKYPKKLVEKWIHEQTKF